VHRRRLRELFEKIEASAAEPFEGMLSTPNALAVTFRDVLHGDPLQYELRGILGKKYAPAPSQCAPAVPAPAPPSGVTLPGVTLTDEGAFDELHAEIEQRITAIREAGSTLTRDEMMAVKAHLLKRLFQTILSRRERARRDVPGRAPGWILSSGAGAMGDRR